MNKEKLVEDLARQIQMCEFKNSMNTTDYVLAEHLIAANYIPKSMALELVKVCAECLGGGGVPWGSVNSKCTKCAGRGTVLREDWK